jgi:WD40 repeat protein
MSLAAAFTALLAVIGIVGWYGHRESQARQRADASRLFAFGQLEIDRNPTLALAFAIASLERADNPEVRRFSIDAMARQPSFFEIDGSRDGNGLAFSPDGLWLAAGRYHTGEILLYSSRGGPPAVLQGPGDHVYEVRFGQGSDAFVTWASGTNLVQVWSVPERRLIRSVAHGQAGGTHLPLFLSSDGLGLLTASVEGTYPDDLRRVRLLRWPPGRDQPVILGELDHLAALVADANGERVAYIKEGGIYLRTVEGFARATPRLVGRQQDGQALAMSRDGDLLAAGDRTGRISTWRLKGDGDPPIAVFEATESVGSLSFDRTGEHLASGHASGTARIWDLRAPPGTPPIELRGRDDVIVPELHPGGDWVATWGNVQQVSLWPLHGRRPRVLYRCKQRGITVRGVAFAPDGSWVAAGIGDSRLAKWPLSHTGGEPLELELPGSVFALAPHPDGRRLLAGMGNGVAMISIEGAPPKMLAGFESWVWAVAFSPDGRLAAAGGGVLDVSTDERFIRAWNLEDGTFRDLRTAEGVYSMQFLTDGRLMFIVVPSSGAKHLFRWTVGEARAELLKEDFGGIGSLLDVSPDGSTVFFEEPNSDGLADSRMYSLKDGSVTRVLPDAFDCRHNRRGTLAVCASTNSTVRVIPLDGRPAHDLVGHTDLVNEVAVSPDDRWVVSIARDGTVRLWPMPEGEPLLPLPRDRFLDRLGALTNLRVVLDPASSKGWKKAFEPPQPGWNSLP